MSDGNNPEQRRRLEKLASNLKDIIPIIEEFTDYDFVVCATWPMIKDINDTLQRIATETHKARRACLSIERTRAEQSYSYEKSKKKDKS